MPRILTGGPPEDPRYTDVADEDVVRRQIEDPDPERHADVTPPTHCPFCSKPLDARLLCAACGDETEEQAA